MADDNATNQDHWCFAWYAAPLATSSEERAALVKGNKWGQGKIRIGFMDGTPTQQALVRKFAEGWIAPGFANRDH